jgi:hypothetical protein
MRRFARSLPGTALRSDVTSVELAPRTERRRAAADDGASDDCPAALAPFTGSPVDGEHVLSIVVVSLSHPELVLDLRRQCARQASGSGPVDSVAGRTRIHPRPPQRFRRDDVADAREHGLIHEHGLDRTATSLKCVGESLDADAVGERVGAELGPVRDVAARDDQTTEATRVQVPHAARALAACDVDARALGTSPRLSDIGGGPLAGHAEVREEPRSVVEEQSEPLPAARDVLNATPGESTTEMIGRQGAQQPSIVASGGANGGAAEASLQAASRDLHVG